VRLVTVGRDVVVENRGRHGADVGGQRVGVAVVVVQRRVGQRLQPIFEKSATVRINGLNLMGFNLMSVNVTFCMLLFGALKPINFVHKYRINISLQFYVILSIYKLII
jgi:hypothetical protein